MVVITTKMVLAVCAGRPDIKYPAWDDLLQVQVEWYEWYMYLLPSPCKDYGCRETYLETISLRCDALGYLLPTRIQYTSIS